MRIHLPWFRFRMRGQGGRQAAAGAAVPARDPLAAIPLRPTNVGLRRDDAGCIHLRLCLRVYGWRARIGRRLRYDFCRIVALDAHGTRFYELVDGERSLRAIAAALAGTLGRSVAESERAVVFCTRDLMRRGFLDLKVSLPQTSNLPDFQSSSILHA